MNTATEAHAHAHVVVQDARDQGIHINVTEGRARICLLGDPRLIIGEALLEIRPPLAFQVLVALALARPRTVSRAEVARTLFPGVDPKERRAQLRIVLGHLRRRLEAASVVSLYSENGTDISLDETVELDTFELLSGEPISLDRLTVYSKPVLVGCNSRFAERCRGLVKNAVEASLPAALSTCGTVPELWSVAPTLGQLRGALSAVSHDLRLPSGGSDAVEPLRGGE